MDHFAIPSPVRKKFLTPGVFVLILLALNGLAFLAGRFIFGIGSVTNLNNQYPWGIWIAIDVATGVALAAGGFTSAALGHVMHRERYHDIIRPALLTAMLGYTFVALGVCIDLGRYYYIWHPLIMWNPNSALFEVGICVTIYLNVLYVEFLPIVVERFRNRVKLPSFLSGLNKPAEKLLALLDGGLSKVMFIFIIAGVVLSCLHQSSLGTLMVIAGPKMHPLWQTPILPLLFLTSAVAVGFPMVIFESILASRSFGIKPEMHILSRLARFVAPILAVYLVIKICDMFIRETFHYLTVINVQSVMFIIEVLIGVIVPMIMFSSRSRIKKPAWIFTASSLVIFGVVVNRINNFIIAYHPPYSTGAYWPSIGEISVTVGFIAILILLYRACVIIFPVISQPHTNGMPEKHYTIGEMIK